jgi:hypothetical protein
MNDFGNDFGCPALAAHLSLSSDDDHEKSLDDILAEADIADASNEEFDLS